MSVTFPLGAMHHNGRNDKPAGPDAWAIFDAKGYWANLGGYLYQQPSANPESRRNCETVAKMLNAAYEQGKADASAEIRGTIKAALGIES